VTVDDVKLYARVAYSIEDTLIDTWIKSATKLAEEYQHRAYIEQTWTLTYDNFPGTCIEIPICPLMSVESIKYIDSEGVESTFDSSNYFVDLTSEVGRIVLNDGVTWPSVDLRAANGLVIEFKAGYSDSADDTPQSVKNAIYIFCTHMFENREAENGTIPEEFYDLLRPDRMAVY
jgi:uncharacterized phiE125 gp8 family phage protein